MPAQSLEFIVPLAEYLLVLIFKLTGPSSAVPTYTNSQMISSVVDVIATRQNLVCQALVGTLLHRRGKVWLTQTRNLKLVFLTTPIPDKNIVSFKLREGN